MASRGQEDQHFPLRVRHTFQENKVPQYEVWTVWIESKRGGILRYQIKGYYNIPDKRI